MIGRTLGIVLAVACLAGPERTAKAQDREDVPPSAAAVEAEIRELALPVQSGVRPGRLVDRPIVCDFQEHALSLLYRSRKDERIEPVAAPTAGVLPFDVHAVHKEAGVDYRRRLRKDVELGLFVPFESRKQSRPSRILPQAAPLLFSVTDDVRADSGIGDLRLSLAHASNEPARSRRLGIEVTIPTGNTDAPGASGLALGSGQVDWALSWAAKTTRGDFALTRQLGVVLREEGTVPAFIGTRVHLSPGNELFAKLRGDLAIADWWTASLAAHLSTSERVTIDGAEQPGSSRQSIVLTPSVTYQASARFEVLAGVDFPIRSRNSGDGAQAEISTRWRW